MAPPSSRIPGRGDPVPGREKGQAEEVDQRKDTIPTDRVDEIASTERFIENWETDSWIPPNSALGKVMREYGSLDEFGFPTGIHKMPSSSERSIQEGSKDSDFPTLRSPPEEQGSVWGFEEYVDVLLGQRSPSAPASLVSGAEQFYERILDRRGGTSNVVVLSGESAGDTILEAAFAETQRPPSESWIPRFDTEAPSTLRSPIWSENLILNLDRWIPKEGMENGRVVLIDRSGAEGKAPKLMHFQRFQPTGQVGGEPFFVVWKEAGEYRMQINWTEDFKFEGLAGGKKPRLLGGSFAVDPEGVPKYEGGGSVIYGIELGQAYRLHTGGQDLLIQF